MAVTEHASGTVTPTLDVESFLGTDPDNTDGAFQFVVNLTNLADGEFLRVRVYEAALSTDSTSDIAFEKNFSHSQAEDLFVSPALLLMHRWRFAVLQSAGTARAYKWSVRRVA